LANAIGNLNLKNVIAAVVFILLGLYLSSIVPSIEVAWVTAILLLTIYLFAFEIVPVDVAAVSVMVTLGWLTQRIYLMVFPVTPLCPLLQL